MRTYGQKPAVKGTKRYLVLSLPSFLPGGLKKYFWVILVVLGSNYLSHKLWNDGPGLQANVMVNHTEELYLTDKASTYIPNTHNFTDKVKEIAQMLDVPPEWLMTVMYAESKFDAGVANFKGSGAVGLIQFMPTTAQDMNISVERLQRMTPVQQLEYVFLYLQRARERYGEYDSLTDLYLAILYPKARKQDYCYTLYAKPTRAYNQNSGLDEDKDGRVNISDIDRHMKRLYPEAYMIEKYPQNGEGEG
ncbi:MAG: transglycosylase SLT domain-containing protein [Bacteroidota bacterium]